MADHRDALAREERSPAPDGPLGNATAQRQATVTEIPGARSSNGQVEQLASRRAVIRQTLVNASGVVVLQAASVLMGFGLAILLARLLGGVGYGRYAYALAWASLLTTPALLGLDRFLVRGMAVYEVNGDWGLIKGLIKRTNELVLAASGVLVGGSCLIAVLFLSGTLRWTFFIAMFLIPLTGLTLLRQAAMQAIGRVVSGQLPEDIVRPVVILAGVGTLALVDRNGLTSTTAVAINVAGVAVAFLVGATMLRKALPRTLQTVRAQYETRSWLRASLPMMLVAGVWWANNYVAILVVGTIDGTRSAGIYSVVEKGAELIVLVLIASNLALAPVIARMHARQDELGLEHATERIAQATLLASIPLVAFFAIFPDAYLSVFGSAFQAGATALTILALAQLFNAAAGPAGNVLIMTGNERAAVRGVGAGLLVNVVLGVALVPALGVTGGAIASGSSLLVWNTVLVLLARRHVGVNVTALPWAAKARRAVPAPAD